MGCQNSSVQKDEVATNGAATNGQAKAPAPTVQVFGMPVSANAISAVLVAMEAGCGQLELCDLMQNQQMQPEFLAMNPFHHIPTVKDGDFAMGESNACLRYLAMKYKSELYPVSDPALCGLIDFACDSFACDVYPKISGVFYPVFGFKGPNDDQEKVNKETTEVLDTWMKTFVKGKFACSDKLTIADYKAVPFLFVTMQPAIEKKTGFKLSERAKQYVTDFMEAVKASEFMKNANGFSLAEYAASKDTSAGAPIPVAKGSFPPTPALGKPDGKIKVHGLPISPNAMSAVLLAKDLGVGDLELCDLSKGAHMTPEFLAKNPFHHIPTMEDGAYAIGESNAILRYLAMKYRPECYPVKDPAACGKIDFACESFAGDVYPKIAFDIIYPVFGFAKYPKDASRQEDQGKCNAVAGELLDKWLNHFVGRNKFVNGESLSIADYKAAPFLFALMQPAILKKTGFKLSDAAKQYTENVVNAFKSPAPLDGIIMHCGKQEAAAETGL